MIRRFQCGGCKHLHPVRYRKGYTCTAFPDGIPEEIVRGYSHHQPYPNDNGIRFEETNWQYSRAEVEKWLNMNDPELLPYALRKASLYDENYSWLENIFIRYAEYSDEYVRCEAFQCLARLADKGFQLDKMRVRPLIENGLKCRQGSEEWVAALTAACAIENKLRWFIGASELHIAYMKQFRRVSL
jgi:hypothetical protein